MGGAFGVNGHRGNVTPMPRPISTTIPMRRTGSSPPLAPGDHRARRHPAEHLHRRLSGCPAGRCGEPGRFLWDVSRFYLRFYSERIGMAGCHVHDPSAIAYVIDPALFTLRKGPVRVITEGPHRPYPAKFDDTRHPHDEWAPARPSRSGSRCGIRPCSPSIGIPWWPGARGADKARQ